MRVRGSQLVLDQKCLSLTSLCMCCGGNWGRCRPGCTVPLQHRGCHVLGRINNSATGMLRAFRGIFNRVPFVKGYSQPESALDDSLQANSKHSTSQRRRLPVFASEDVKSCRLFFYVFFDASDILSRPLDTGRTGKGEDLGSSCTRLSLSELSIHMS